MNEKLQFVETMYGFLRLSNIILLKLHILYVHTTTYLYLSFPLSSLIFSLPLSADERNS